MQTDFSSRDVRQKLERFRQSIMNQAEGQCREIQQQLEAYRTAELGRYKDDARDDTGHMLQDEQARIAAEAAAGISQRKNELKQALFQKRAELTDQLFEKARQQLLDFSGCAGEYGLFLQEKARRVMQLCPDGQGLTLLVRPQDRAFEGQLRQICGAQAALEEDATIQIGGLRARLAGGTVIDETLDAALEAQREWFYDHAALFIE